MCGLTILKKVKDVFVGRKHIKNGGLGRNMTGLLLLPVITGFIFVTPDAEGATYQDVQNSFATLKAAIDATIAQDAVIVELVNALFKTPQSLNFLTIKGSAGTSISVPVIYAAGPVQVSSLQFDLTLPQRVTFGSATAGMNSINNQKNVQASTITGGIRVIVFGINQTNFGSGIICNLKLNLASNITPGTKTLTIKNIVASDPAGNAVTVTGNNGSIAVQ